MGFDVNLPIEIQPIDLAVFEAKAAADAQFSFCERTNTLSARYGKVEPGKTAKENGSLRKSTPRCRSRQTISTTCQRSIF
jgi:hypothetical protein